LTKNEPASGNLITFAQFLLISIEGLIFQMDGFFKLKKTKIPIQCWGLMVCLFWTVSILNNYALGFKIPMPLHIIFRSGSVMVSMLIGYLFFDRKFSKSQILGVFLVTFGVILSTIASNSSTKHSDSPIEFSIGLGILIIAQILSCLLGQYQQIVYHKYGRHWREGLFYTHSLCLPMFGLFYSDIKNQIIKYNSSPAIYVNEFITNGYNPLKGTLIVRYISKSVIAKVLENVSSIVGIRNIIDFSYSIKIPSQWLFLVLNITTQCI
jgi:UDP-xylose/UDP-N-acetylglucosamine transporter B4